MPSANAEFARQATAAWNEGGADAFLEYLDPDVEWNPPAESMEPGVYRGHAGVRRYIDRLGEIFDERHAETLESLEIRPGLVLVLVRIYGRSEKFDTELDLTWAWLTTVADGKCTRVDMFLRKEEALAAAQARS